MLIQIKVEVNVMVARVQIVRKSRQRCYSNEQSQHHKLGCAGREVESDAD